MVHLAAARTARASQVLVSDHPLGPFQAFSNEPTLPPEMMTLDGTLWVEKSKRHFGSDSGLLEGQA